ncbi:hypothetical protein [Marinobacter sp.]|uniref:hypothetical protein n=1 Tax=Marinobacter sp. TaxID=50741 RepID=UPI003B51EC3D
MKKLTLILTTIALLSSANVTLAMNGKADRINEARSFPNKTVDVEESKKAADVKESAE